MTIRVGLIGAGTMGAEHASIMAREIGGCSLEAIADTDRGRAAAIASKLGIRKVEADGLALVDDPQIDAVLIASSDETHFDLSMTCVRLGKPVFCEKPLAMTSTDCLRLVEAEMGVGQRLLQVGFMRRFDEGYRNMKTAVDGKRFGSPLFLHCIHRIATAPHYFKTELIPFASAVHEIDAARFVLSEEFIRVSVYPGRQSAKAPERSPLLFIFQSASGVLMDIEISTDAQYGYDVRAELVMESGALALVPPSASTISWDGSVGDRVHGDWTTRFAPAYPRQATAWIRSIATKIPCGASAWDGYVATKLAEDCVTALREASNQNLTLESEPDFYATP
jgi:myo-inositol 2-dehydrogenase/D-chiro-inositol 1-dehydrogenase